MGPYTAIYSQFDNFIPGTEINIHYTKDTISNEKTYTKIEMTGFDEDIAKMSEKMSSGKLADMVLYDEELIEQIIKAYSQNQSSQTQ